MNKKFWVLIASILVIVFTAQLVVSNILAAKGNTLAQLERESAQLARGNKIIRQEMSEYGSLAKIDLAAQDLGMVKPESVLYIDLTAPIAAVPTVQ